MTDQELFDPVRIAARVAEYGAWEASRPTGWRLSDAERAASAATCAANGVSSYFDGTYENAPNRTAGWKNPPPPGTGGVP